MQKMETQEIFRTNMFWENNQKSSLSLKFFLLYIHIPVSI